MQLKLIHAFGEIGLRGGFHPERLPAECDFIEVQRHDLLLGQRAFNALRQNRFFDLAGVTILIRQQKVFGDLLRYRRGTARAFAAEDIVKNSRSDTGIIDTAMAKECFIFCGHIGPDQ